jgi:hypothetical protein
MQRSFLLINGWLGLYILLIAFLERPGHLYCVSLSLHASRTLSSAATQIHASASHTWLRKYQFHFYHADVIARPRLQARMPAAVSAFLFSMLINTFHRHSSFFDT